MLEKISGTFFLTNGITKEPTHFFSFSDSHPKNGLTELERRVMVSILLTVDEYENERERK
jgi:hypothetical protein